MFHRSCALAMVAGVVVACSDPLRPADTPDKTVVKPAGARVTNGITIINLGSISPDGGSVARDVNANGAIVGYASTQKYEPNAYMHAMRWTVSAAGVVSQDDLMPLLGLPTIADAYALALNDAGTIVGSMRTSDQQNDHGFILSASGVVDIHAYPRCDGSPDDTNLSSARDINNNGEVVGYKGHQPNPTNAAGYSFYLDLRAAAPCLVQLPGLATPGVAYAISDSSVIVGESFSESVGWAVRWRKSGSTWTISKLGRDSTRAWAINLRGDVAGQFAGPTRNVDQHALLWRNSAGTLVERELGTLGGPQSVANGIDVSGRVVGWAHNKQWNMHAFDWTESAGMRDLGTLGGKRSGANAVNGKRIVGDSEIATAGNEIIGRATLWKLP